MILRAPRVDIDDWATVIIVGTALCGLVLALQFGVAW